MSDRRRAPPIPTDRPAICNIIITDRTSSGSRFRANSHHGEREIDALKSERLGKLDDDRLVARLRPPIAVALSERQQNTRPACMRDMCSRSRNEETNNEARHRLTPSTNRLLQCSPTRPRYLDGAACGAVLTIIINAIPNASHVRRETPAKRCGDVASARR